MAEPAHPPAAVEAVVSVLSDPNGSGFPRSMNVAMTTAVGRRILDAVAPEIRADERQRVYAELGSEHYVIFTEDRFTVEHSVECKLSGHMHECAYHEAIALIADEYDPDRLGRWRITGISEGLPDLERAEREVPGA